MHWHGLRYDTKLVLWTLFLIQVFLIGIVLIFQGVSNESGKGGVNDDFKVHFIKSEIKFDDTLSRNQLESYQENKIEVKAITNFTLDFISLAPLSSQYQQQKDPNTGQQQQLTNLTCFRQGTANQDEYSNYPKNRIQKCECLAEWHGKDCGQPEILWRAFMTSKVPLTLSSDARSIPHKVFYMITGNFHSLELLEIQIMELETCVDFFIICYKKDNSKTNTKRLKLNFANQFLERFLIIDNNSNENEINNNDNCSPKLVYKEFRNRIADDSIKSDDIFIFSHDDEILNRRAVKYLKYYDNSSGLIRFRLKYNIYGFFWQHPESTRLGSAACTIRQLEETYKSDPERLILARKPGIIVGDLNHFGGWFCEFCYQPTEIIERLQLGSLTIFPRTPKNRQIDASYIQNLIASGLYIDGKLGLNKLHRFSDKYYAPEYAEENGWKFDNILINLYLSFNDDDSYES